MGKHIKICEFTVPELDRFRQLCNFTPEELEVFELKSHNKSNIEVSMALSMSERKVSSLISAIAKKIIRVL